MQRKPSQVLMSDRDRAAVREREEFVKAELEKQRLAEDKAEYQKYRKTFGDEQQSLPRAYRMEALDFDSWRSYAPQDESDPVLRGLQATQRSLLKRTAEAEREAVQQGRTDPAWVLPESVSGLSMSETDARAFNKQEFKKFVANNPNFDPATTTQLTDYLFEQGVNIGDEATFKYAFERLLSLGLITERQPEPETQPQEPGPEPVERVLAKRILNRLLGEEQPSAEVAEGMEEGIDPTTGQRRLFHPREIEQMSSEQYRAAFMPQHFIPTMATLLRRV